MKNEVNNEDMKLEFRRLEGYSEKELLALILVELKSPFGDETDQRSAEDIREMEEEGVFHVCETEEPRFMMSKKEWIWFWIIYILVSPIAIDYMRGVYTGLGWMN